MEYNKENHCNFQGANYEQEEVVYCLGCAVCRLHGAFLHTGAPRRGGRSCGDGVAAVFPAAGGTAVPGDSPGAVGDSTADPEFEHCFAGVDIGDAHPEFNVCGLFGSVGAVFARGSDPCICADGLHAVMDREPLFMGGSADGNA